MLQHDKSPSHELDRHYLSSETELVTLNWSVIILNKRRTDLELEFKVIFIFEYNEALVIKEILHLLTYCPWSVNSNIFWKMTTSFFPIPNSKTLFKETFRIHRKIFNFFLKSSFWEFIEELNKNSEHSWYLRIWLKYGLTRTQILPEERWKKTETWITIG